MLQPATWQFGPHRRKVQLGCFLWLLFASSLVRAETNISVDWQDTTYRINRLAFGLNGFKSIYPKEVSNPQYLEKLKYMLGTPSPKGLLRIHTWEMVADDGRGWVDSQGNWKAQQIQQSVAPLINAGFTLVINIPDGTDSSNRVDNSQGFAAWCAELVKIVNRDAKLKVTYWEIPNERDRDRDGKTLANIFNQAAKAMKQVDPSIVVGGPAYEAPHRWDEVRAFIRATKEHLGFLSFHNYGGDGNQEAQTAWKNAGGTWISKNLRTILTEEIADRRVPIWHNEFNISWTWKAGREQMNGIAGAIFDALTLSRGLDAGTDVLNAWNEKDGVYGKMDQDTQLRPAAHVFHLFNHYVSGDRVTSQSDNPDNIVAFAARESKTGRHSLVLTNWTTTEEKCNVAMKGHTPLNNIQIAQLTETGLKSPTGIDQNTIQSGFNLPALSMTVFTWIASTSADSKPAESEPSPADDNTGQVATMRDRNSTSLPDAGNPHANFIDEKNTTEPQRPSLMKGGCNMGELPNTLNGFALFFLGLSIFCWLKRQSTDRPD